jgi:hypothetical protein
MRVIVYGDQGESDEDVEQVAQIVANHLSQESVVASVTFRSESGDQEVTGTV